MSANTETGQQEKERKKGPAGIPVIIWVLGGGALTLCFLMFFFLLVVAAAMGPTPDSINNANAKKLENREKDTSIYDVHPDYIAGYYTGFTWLETSGRQLLDEDYELHPRRDFHIQRTWNRRWRNAKAVAKKAGKEGNQAWMLGHIDGSMDAIIGMPNQMKAMDK